MRKDKTNLAVKGRYAQTLRGLIWGFNFFVGHGKDLPSPRLFDLGVTFELVQVPHSGFDSVRLVSVSVIHIVSRYMYPRWPYMIQASEKSWHYAQPGIYRTLRDSVDTAAARRSCRTQTLFCRPLSIYAVTTYHQLVQPC